MKSLFSMKGIGPLRRTNIALERSYAICPSDGRIDERIDLTLQYNNISIQWNLM